MARDAAAAVGAHILEKGIGSGVRRSSKIEVGETPVGIRELLKTPHHLIRIGAVCDGEQPSRSQE